VWHWSHYRKADCDHWWENETPWHRDWKNRFPVDWQEVIHYADNGEKHIADVKTPNGSILEFQHSRISPDERRSREAFYKNLIWVVDGQRLERARTKFYAAIRQGKILTGQQQLTLTFPLSRHPMIREWAQRGAAVFFDFGDAHNLEDLFVFGAPVLWHLDPRTPNDQAILTPVLQIAFVESIHKGRPCRAISAPAVVRLPDLPRPRITGFGREMARRKMARARFRL
jgi:hypothetical protein